MFLAGFVHIDTLLLTTIFKIKSRKKLKKLKRKNVT